MTRAQMFFLFLMICTAVITGTALGIISNFDILQQQSQLVITSTATASDELPNEEQSAEKGDCQEQTSSGSTSVASYDQVSRSTQLMVVTAQEKEEIRKMMLQLGMSEDEQESDFISKFQRSHNLSITGTLDSQTLNTMIKQVTYNSAARATNSSPYR
ncbi:MAG: hypothetical protein WBJ34_12145 [Syntrophomonadaceae bacterium]